MTCGAAGAERGQRAFLIALRNSKRALHRSSARAAKISSSNESFNETIGRSVSDLYMLLTEKREGPYPYAGVPWFSTVFGRDALITALQTLWLDPAIAAGVLGHLAANQATTTDPEADAEPGKILHEARNGEMADLGRGAIPPLLRQRRFDAAFRHARRRISRTHRRLPHRRATLAAISRPRSIGW